MRPSGAASSPRWGNPLCVCVCLCATQPGAGCGVWVQLVRRLRGKEGRARCDATQPVVDRRLRSAACACACVRRAEGEGAARASWSHKCLRAGVGHYQRTKRKPTGAVQGSQRGACASARPPDPVAEGAPAQRPGGRESCFGEPNPNQGLVRGPGRNGQLPRSEFEAPSSVTRDT